MEPLRQLSTRQEIADLLCVSKGYLDHAAVRGDGPPIVRVGPRAVRYDRVAVNAWLSEQARPAAAA